MNELPEALIAAYVDGELSPEEVRELELHLVRSRESRELVIALQEEAALLRDVLQERPRESPVPTPVRAPARGIALGLAPALFATGVVVSVLGWLIDTRLPSGLGVLNPMNWIGAYEMAFNVIFWLRDQAPGLFELLLAVAVTASLSALLSFGVSVLFRRFASTALILLFVGVGLHQPAEAIDLRHEEQVTIHRSETIDDKLVVSADTVYIEGTVNGDLLAFCEHLVVNGLVRGNVFAITQSTEVSGVIEGSLISGSGRTAIDGRIEHDLYSVGEFLKIGRKGRIGRDTSLFVGEVTLNGRHGRNLFGGADRLELRGEVGGDVDLGGDRISFLDGARIRGNVTTRAGRFSQVDVAPGARIDGEMTERPHRFHLSDRKSRFTDPGFYLRIGALLVSAFLLGMILHQIVPGIFRGRLETTPDFFRSLGFGFLALVATPIVLALGFITVVGIPIALIGVWVYLTSLFVSMILVAALIGRALLGREGHTPLGFGLSLLLGLLIVGVAVNLPYVGGLIAVLVLLTGLGLLVGLSLASWRRGGGLQRSPSA